MAKGYKISKEIKDEIINRIKNDGVNVADAAKNHGISEKTIYGWLGKKAEGEPSWSEVRKLKREKVLPQRAMRLLTCATSLLTRYPITLHPCRRSGYVGTRKTQQLCAFLHKRLVHSTALGSN